MKSRFKPFLFSLSLTLSLPASAAVLHWDGTDTTPDADGGAGFWDTITTNWDDFATAGSDTAWPSPATGDDDASFGGPASGIVTIDTGGITVNDITFLTAGYTINGDPLTLDSSLTTPVISNGVSATINANLIGSGGLNKTGNGTLALTGDNSSLTGTLEISGTTSGTNGGIVLSGSASMSGLTDILIRQNSFLSLNGVTLPSTVAISVAGGGGPTPATAPTGALRGGAGANVVQGPVALANGLVRLGNLGTSTTFNGAITAPPESGFGILFRNSSNQGTILSNASNSWEGETVLGDGSVYFHPGALPSTSKLRLAGSGNTWFETNGTFSRSIGTGSGQIEFNNTANRINGLSARGGDLTINLGGNETPDSLVWGTAGFVPGALGLAGANATGTLTWLNPIDLNSATRTIDVANGTAEVDARISGPLTNGVLAKTGNGTLALAAANSFTSATLVFGTASTDRGALRLEHNDALSGITLIDMNSAVNSSARARVELSGGVTISGVDIRTGGHGDVTGAGAALANRSGDNTWSGVIRISNTGGSYGIRSDAGTLTLSGTLQNGIGSNREWTVGGAGDILVSGNVINGGASGLNISKFGAGTLTLTGSNNTYSLGTTINEGNLHIGNGGTTGSPGTGPISNNSTLVFNRDGDLTVPGAISGTGEIINRGPGIVTLSATLTHTGNTSIEDGTLLINGDASAATGPITIGDGIGAAASATLGGIGFVGADATLASDGAIAPGGDTVNFFDILGNVSGTGTILIEIDETESDRLVVDGTLDITSLNLNLSTVATPTAPTYIIIDGDSPITGAAFASVTGLPSGYTLEYNYDDGSDSNNIALVSTGGTPFTTWATTNGLAGPDAAPDADPDLDGLDNLIEFVLGTQPNPANPNASSTQLAPTIAVDETNLTFTFRRTTLSGTQPGLTVTAEYGSNLTAWTPAVDGTDGVAITTTPDGFGTGVDRVEVTVPKSLAVDDLLFVRLKATLP